MAGIYEALLKVQKEINNPQNTATNPFLKSKYAPLPDILNQVRPLLTKNKILMIQNTGSQEDGTPFIQTKLIYAGDDKNGLENVLESDKLIINPDKKTAQGIGGAITYGRRYQLSALLGISSEDDNDGNGKAQSSKPQPKESKTKTTNKPKSPKRPKSVQKSNEAEEVDMTNGDRVNLSELLGINDELDKYIHMAEDVGATAKEIYNECEELLGKQQLTPTEMKKVKEAIGMPVE